MKNFDENEIVKATKEPVEGDDTDFAEYYNQTKISYHLPRRKEEYPFGLKKCDYQSFMLCYLYPNLYGDPLIHLNKLRKLEKKNLIKNKSFKKWKKRKKLS